MTYTNVSPSPMPGILALGDTPRRAVRGPRRWGLIVILIFLAVFGGWGGFAPLSGGTVASGKIAPYGSVRTVQHLEGGIVKKILVRDGDTVAVGAPLIELQGTMPEAEVEMLMDRYRARAAEAARLEAELAGERTIAFPADLLADPAAQEVISAETRILAARENLINARKRMLAQQIEQLEEQIAGYTAQLKSSTSQLELVTQEIADKQILFDQGLSLKVEMLRLKREAAQIEGFRGEYTASIAGAKQRIGEAEVELLAIDAERIENASQRAGQVRGELAEIKQSLGARRDVLERTVITAPVSGVVANLQLKTEGGVLGSGQAVLDIVPSDEKLVVEAEVSPMDIDLVKTGMEAHVQFNALSARLVPKVTGVVTNVSADTTVAQSGGSAHYKAKVEVERSEIEAAGATDLQVGMPADILIVARERTLLQYITQPFTEALWRAGREI